MNLHHVQFLIFLPSTIMHASASAICKVLIATESLLLYSRLHNLQRDRQWRVSTHYRGFQVDFDCHVQTGACAWFPIQKSYQNSRMRLKILTFAVGKATVYVYIIVWFLILYIRNGLRTVSLLRRFCESLKNQQTGTAPLPETIQSHEDADIPTDM